MMTYRVLHIKLTHEKCLILEAKKLIPARAPAIQENPYCAGHSRDLAG